MATGVTLPRFKTGNRRQPQQLPAVAKLTRLTQFRDSKGQGRERRLEPERLAERGVVTQGVTLFIFRDVSQRETGEPRGTNSGIITFTGGLKELRRAKHLQSYIGSKNRFCPLDVRFAGKPGLLREERAEFDATLQQVLTGGA